MHNVNDLLKRALQFEFLSAEEGVFLFEHAPLTDLMLVADDLRKKQKPDGKVTWIIDRNVNTTNVCIANCKFCNFYRVPGHADAYITDIETYKTKVAETIKYEQTIKIWIIWLLGDLAKQYLLKLPSNALISYDTYRLMVCTRYYKGHHSVRS